MAHHSVPADGARQIYYKPHCSRPDLDPVNMGTCWPFSIPYFIKSFGTRCVQPSVINLSLKQARTSAKKHLSMLNLHCQSQNADSHHAFWWDQNIFLCIQLYEQHINNIHCHPVAWLLSSHCASLQSQRWSWRAILTY